MSALSFELASERDDADLRRLLRENPIPGSISLSFEREPCYFDASLVEGPFHQTIIARESDSATVIACGNRSVRPLHVSGQVQDIGYMSQLRVNPVYGQGMYLARGLAGGFRKYRELHQDGRAPFYLMSVIQDNLPARRLLTSGLPDYPHARVFARMFTYAVHPVRRKRDLPLPPSTRIVRGDETYADAIVDCLNFNNARKQFAPYWTRDSLFRSNLSPADFFLALDGDHVVGCLACWDQSAFKQTIVRGYSGPLAHWRKVINFFSHFVPLPYLPEPNTPLRHSYACHFAIDNDDPVIFKALLRKGYNYVAELNYSYLMIGLAESNPLRTIVEAYRPLTYISQIYLMDWNENGELLTRIDERIPGLEIALL
jgi:hypothetical protein